MPLLPLLPQLDVAEQALRNRLLRRRKPWRGQAAGVQLEIAFGGQHSENAAWVVPARLGMHSLQLHLNAALFERLLGTMALQRDFAGLPAVLQSVLLEQALLPWIEPLEAALGQPLSLDAEPCHGEVDLNLQLSADGAPLGTLTLQLSRAAAQSIADLLERHVPPARQALPTLPLSLTLLRGCQTLSLAELCSLQPGDVLMLDCPADADGLLLLAGGHRQARFKRQKSGLQLLEALQPTNPTMENAMGQDADDAQLDDVPLTVVCQIGSLEMPLGELRELGEGSVLALPHADAQRVELMINGRCVGRGELVAIGDGLGVRLTRFASL
ncbi:type III secretion system cytoplasmic ring protein SctQ [Pseudomonas sp. CNPSo 3701]|uniref:type III secretion system cytoplasmic ring protein SctQ n=1 Tax=Pseudomonas sp. CNPSo 3701 TaxID=3027943 RepID=UPI0023638180|nr:type III secretion system cytoplasmic ring protein SctQ [Pseudomonas sp. CNPSo 3701]MDD1510194.1 type III secretion system cytoplasmic ring protein SctQ [Pseudomonas sp. CNPSo 3701]